MIVNETQSPFTAEYEHGTTGHDRIWRVIKTKQILPKFVTVAPDGRWVFHLDNHLCGVFDSCERRFEYRHVQYKALKGLPKFKMTAGSWWSLVMKDYYEKFAILQKGFTSPGTMLSPTKQDIMQFAAKRWLEMKMDVYKNAPGKDSEHYAEFGGHTGAMNMALTYWLTWSELDAKTFRVIGAESGFGLKNEVLVGESSSVVVFLTGIPDLVVLENGKYLAPLDHKSKDYLDPNVLDEYKPDNQLTGYCVAVKALAASLGYTYPVEYAIVNLCGRLEPKTPKDPAKHKQPRYRRLPIFIDEDTIVEWKQGRVRLAERMRAAFESGFFARTDDRIQCHSVYNSACAYRKLCSLPPRHRDIEMRSNYVDIMPWEPYKLGPKETNGGGV